MCPSAWTAESRGNGSVSRFTKVELEGVTGKKAVNSDAMTVKK
jgi:hypothetical protein